MPSAAMIALTPTFIQALPPVLSVGRVSAVQIPHPSPLNLLYASALMAVFWVTPRVWVPVLLAMSIIGTAFFIKFKMFPILDERVSTRMYWKEEIQPISEIVCEEWIRRDWVYGLSSFFRGRLIPPCYRHSTEWHLVPQPNGVPVPEIVRK
jgi:hypothetical protein